MLILRAYYLSTPSLSFFFSLPQNNLKTVRYNNKQVMISKEYRKQLHDGSNGQSVCHQQMKYASYQASPRLSSTNSPSYAEESPNNLLFSDSYDQSGNKDDSVASLDEEIVEQHFRWLNHSTSKICDKLLWTAILTRNYSAFETHQIQHEDSLVEYLKNQKSLVPKPMVTGLVQFLTQVPKLQDLLEWMYGHVQAKFGDELILIAFRVIMAYLPIKHTVLSFQQIRAIPLLTFNMVNIFNDPSLRILHLSSFYRVINNFVWVDIDLYRFCAAYVETILLVLEQYFQNPHYKQIQEEERRGEGSNNRPWKKKKKIVKNK